MENIIVINKEDDNWVAGISSQIKKGELSCTDKFWRTLVLHRLLHTFGNNILSPNQPAQVQGIIGGYDINIYRLLAQEIGDSNFVIESRIPFPCFLTQIFLEASILGLPDVDQFIVVHHNNNLGMIRDSMNFVSRVKVVACVALLGIVFYLGTRMKINTFCFTDIEAT